MAALFGLLILLVLIAAGAWAFGLVFNWYVTLPVAALAAVIFGAIRLNAGKRP